MTEDRGGRVELEAELDALYRAPLDQFVARRDALVKALRAAGSSEDALRVKALRKPTAVAWAINRLHLERGGLREIAGASEALRTALGEARSAEARREAIEARRRALERATGAVVKLLEESGSAVSPALLRRIERTLLAVTTATSAPGARTPAPGRLDQELEPPGFEAMFDAPVPSAVPTVASGSGALKESSAAKSTGPVAVAMKRDAAGMRKTAAASPSPAAAAPAAPPPPPATAARQGFAARDPEREAAVRTAQKAVDDADAELERATFEVEGARTRVGDAERALQAARRDVDAARRALAATRSRRDELRRELDRVRHAPAAAPPSPSKSKKR